MNESESLKNEPMNEPVKSAPAMETEKPPEPMWKKTLKFLIKFGVSAGILAYIICTRDIKWQDFKLVKPWCIVAAFFAIYTQLSLTAVRWFTLLRAAGVKCSFREAFSLQMQGMFFSQFLPGGSVGGDVVKAGILATRTPPGGKFNVVFSIFVDRLCGLGALLIALLGTCLICHDTIAKFPEGQRNGLLVMCAVCGALLCVVIFVFFSDLLYKVKFFKFFLDIADRITKDTGRCHDADLLSRAQPARVGDGERVRGGAAPRFPAVPHDLEREPDDRGDPRVLRRHRHARHRLRRDDDRDGVHRHGERRDPDPGHDGDAARGAVLLGLLRLRPRKTRPESVICRKRTCFSPEM